jgi:glycosyltransferase involved in cell wall biosynthesis
MEFKENKWRKIKLVHIVNGLSRGGVESVIWNYFTNYEFDSNYDIHIITQDRNDLKCLEDFQDKFKIHIITHKKKSVLKNFREMNEILKREKFDIVHAHMSATNFYALFFASLNGCKIRICHAHATYGNQNGMKLVFFKCMAFLSKLMSTNYMACGKKAAEFQFGKKALKDNRVYILNNAISLDKYKFTEERRTTIRSELNLGDKLCIGHVGRFCVEKNHLFLIDIYNEIKKMYYNSKLLLIGDGELYNDVRKRVSEYGLEEDIVFAGSISNPEDYYMAMDVFTLPSLTEGFPVVLIEAECAGVPCFLSNNIDRTCDISKSATFLPLSIGPKGWAENILTSKLGRLDTLSYIKGTNYDICAVAKSLDDYYMLALDRVRIKGEGNVK